MKRTVDQSTAVHVAVREAVATLEDCHPTQLGNLSLVVDGERLDAVLDAPPEELPMLFQYCGYTVSVDDTGTLCVEN
ncbi:HalOD1 output domain-containing protein [Haloarcula hispanica]|uniref:HalOD1 output domain-containing protein n=1 Tax=Haloarcula hispanica TaxID=51589 RepID=UPI0011B684C9|nr:HalOD1 output domain-containing protein [Haloarcula hispanica]